MNRRSIAFFLPALPLAAVAALAGWPRAAAQAQKPAAQAQKPSKISPEAAEFFENSIRPPMAASCYGCHGKDLQAGNLRLDQPISVEMAGKVLARIRGEGGKPRMPQGMPALPDATIAGFATWVKMGAPWPDGAPPVHGNLWSLQPMVNAKPPKPKSKALARWARTPIDAFVAAGLEKAGLTPSPVADRRTLIRRITFDLTGLPPTPAEIDAFLADKKPGAWERVVDRLLASPRYGERQARMWMDIARYADTKGYVFTEDRNYYNAYTYRNWLIDAFNNDLPYDQFITQQLAADRLELGDDHRPLAALGFLTVGRRFLNAEPDIIGDRIDVTTRGFLGLTVQCARCHDHKFDPIPTQDYYSLYSVFASSQENTPPISPKSIRDPWEQHNAKVAAATDERTRLVREQTRALRVRAKEDPAGVGKPVVDTLQSFRENELPSDEKQKILLPVWPEAQRNRLAELTTEIENLKKSAPPTPEFAMGITDKERPVTVNIHKRGNPGNPGDPAPRRFLSCIAGEERTEWKNDSGRLELAHSIANPDNPLTARVMANRVWLGHFGYGIVRTPSDFGVKGEKPTHPELLDWLAWNFSHTNQWSLKKLHRSILLSNTYLQSSNATPAALTKDPENRLLAHQNRRRLDLEQMRDALLASAGVLDTAKVGGKSEELWAGNWTHRRAVYGFIERQNLPGTFKTFDFASPDASSPMRFQTTVPQQALFVMNSPLAADQARALTQRPEIKQAPDHAAQVRALYRTLFGRLPNATEGALGKRYLAGEDDDGREAQLRQTPEWQYGWGVAADTGKVDFHPLPAFVGKTWRGGDKLPDPTLGWASLTAEGGHPGDRSHAVIRRWTSPTDAKVAITGKVRHNDKQGDGIRARVISSRLGVVGTWDVHAGEAQAQIASVDVRKGDILDFVVDCRENESFDSFEWAPRIRRAGAGRAASWDAKAQFAGPAKSNGAPLNRLERYAQALLMSNEFFFVD